MSHLILHTECIKGMIKFGTCYYELMSKSLTHILYADMQLALNTKQNIRTHVAKRIPM